MYQKCINSVHRRVSRRPPRAILVASCLLDGTVRHEPSRAERPSIQIWEQEVAGSNAASPTGNHQRGIRTADTRPARLGRSTSQRPPLVGREPGTEAVAVVRVLLRHHVVQTLPTNRTHRAQSPRQLHVRPAVAAHRVPPFERRTATQRLIDPRSNERA
jgi:hypothetical protein